jgi:hypothetical protein
MKSTVLKELFKFFIFEVSILLRLLLQSFRVPSIATVLSNVFFIFTRYSSLADSDHGVITYPLHVSAPTGHLIYIYIYILVTSYFFYFYYYIPATCFGPYGSSYIYIYIYILVTSYFFYFYYYIPATGFGPYGSSYIYIYIY